DDPGHGQEGEADPDRGARAQVGDARVDEVRACMRVVEDDEEREAGEPRGVGLPLEPVEGTRDRRRRDPVLLYPVEAAAVDLPRLAPDALAGRLPFARRAQVVVER